MNVQTKDIMNRIRYKPPSFNRNSNKLFLIVLHNTLYIQMKIQMEWIVGLYNTPGSLLLGKNSKNSSMKCSDSYGYLGHFVCIND